MKNYFKKFSIMFVMLLAVIGVTAIQNGSVANAATIGQQLRVPENGWQRIDDKDSMIEYLGTWTIQDSRHVTTNEDASLKFQFYGSKLRIISFCRTGGYAPDVKINIDGVNSSINMGISNSGYYVLVFDNSSLEMGYHMVTISNPNYMQSKPWWMIDAIDIDDTGYLVDTNTSISSISLDNDSMNLNVEDIKQLTATTTPAGAQVTWKSSDESIATVDSNGKVTAIKEGQATITAIMTDGSNASDSCIVNVIPKDTEPTEPDPTEQEYIINTAYAKGDNTNNGSGSVTIIFHGTADTTLSVVKTADVEEVWVGDNFTYTIVVTNTGSETAKDVVIRDSAPNHIEFNVNGITTTQGEVDSSTTSSNLIVNVGDIPAGGTVTIKIPVTVV